VDEWPPSVTAEHHLALSTIRAYQCSLRQVNAFLCDCRYGWVGRACQQEFGARVYPVAIVHEWNTIPHFNDYEGDPEARPFTREEIQRLLDYADKQVDRVARAETRRGVGHLSESGGTRWTGPSRPLDQEERWHQAKRLLHDDTLDTDDRVAGLLLLLYAQRPQQSASSLSTTSTSATTQLSSTSDPYSSSCPNPWQRSPVAWSPRGVATPPSATKEPRTGYFPADNPAVASAPTDSANASANSGLRPSQTRSTALFQLATELPEAALARMLSVSTAQSPSPGSTSPQATGPTTQPTLAAEAPVSMHRPARRTDQSSVTTTRRTVAPADPR
jgi:hypothetical protein